MSSANFMAISRDLIEITDTILKQVVNKTEQAALDIGEKIQTISTLSETQSSMVKDIISNVYQEGTQEHEEVADVLKETNSIVDQIFESAKKGDFETANMLGESESYKRLTKQSGALAKQLERLSESDKEVGDILGPVIMALQFQDSVRQSLENVIRIFDYFFTAMTCAGSETLPTEMAEQFWSKVEQQFTSTDDRNIVRRVVYGDDAVKEDEVSGGGALFF